MASIDTNPDRASGATILKWESRLGNGMNRPSPTITAVGSRLCSHDNNCTVAKNINLRGQFGNRSLTNHLVNALVRESDDAGFTVRFLPQKVADARPHLHTGCRSCGPGLHVLRIAVTLCTIDGDEATRNDG